MGKRLFVSVDLDEVTDSVRAVQAGFEGVGGLRVTEPEQAHVTLKFLGDTDTDQIPEVVDAIEASVDASGVGPFEAHVGGLGVFPSLAYISVVWVGVREGRKELATLHEAIEARTTALGFEQTDYDFTPHATIARMDHAEGKETVQRIVRNEEPDIGRLSVDEVRLTESVLTQDGPEYRTVETVSL